MTAPILTVTLNAALDISARTQRLEPRAKLRSDDVRYDAGGGGLNVARVLHRLGCDVQALYAAGGSSGDHIERLLAAEGVPAERVITGGETRSNFAVAESASGEEYRFVLPGPHMNGADWLRIRDRVATLCPAGGCMIASGSVPLGAPVDAYAEFARIAQGLGCRMILDASGPSLLKALEAGVHTIKPSRGELLAATGAADIDAAMAIARDWIAAGRVERVAISLGEAGARLVTATGEWSIAPPRQATATTLGAGDAFVAGLVSADAANLGPADALRWAAAVASCAVSARGFVAITSATVKERVRSFRP